MSVPNQDIIMADGELTFGPSEGPVIENSLGMKPLTAGPGGYNDKQTSGSQTYSLGSPTRQHALKSKEQLDQTSPVHFEIESDPRSCQEKNEIPRLESSLLAAEYELENSLKETRINADTISQLEKKLSQSNISLKATKFKFTESQSRCKDLQLQIKALGEELKETREHVFRLQPLWENITQSDALREYTAICHSVRSWIGLRLDNALNTGNINTAKINTGFARKLLDLLTKSGLDGILYSDTDEHNIIAVVMEFLRTEIFDTELYGAVEEQNLEFIFQIQRNMKNLVPRRGK